MAGVPEGLCRQRQARALGSRSSRHSLLSFLTVAPQQLLVSRPCHPFRARDDFRTPEDDPRDLAPVGAVRIGIEHASIRDEMRFVVPRERWIGGREIGDIGVERSACIQAEVANFIEYQPTYDFTFPCGGPSFR